MQLMPGTASEMGVQDSFKPTRTCAAARPISIPCSPATTTTWLWLSRLQRRPAGGGPSTHGIPPYHETQAYVARVIHEFNRRVLAREALARETQSASQPRPPRAGALTHRRKRPAPRGPLPP